jgi:cell division protease FtsH
MVMSEDEKRLTAYHEAGHALVMLHVPGHEPLHKVTIIPRGRALGLTMALPERDRLSLSLGQLKAMIASLFGGRVAEEMIFGREAVTTGSSNDIQRATDLSRKMVTEYGYSDKLGPLRYIDNQEEIFLGHSVTQHKNVSDSTNRMIDEEVRRFVEEGESTARAILTEHADQLDAIAKGLLEYETLSRDEVDAILRGEAVVRNGSSYEPPKPKDPPRRTSVPTTQPGGGFNPGPEPQPGA